MFLQATIPYTFSKEKNQMYKYIEHANWHRCCVQGSAFGHLCLRNSKSSDK
jgi:hypothetical protein